MGFEGFKRLGSSTPGRVSLATSLAALIAWLAGPVAISDEFARLNGWWVAASVLLLAPQALLSAARWKWLARSVCHIGLAESLLHSLAAAAARAWNPAKTNEWAKATMLPVADSASCAAAGSRAMLERVTDFAALATLWACAIGGQEVLAAACGALIVAGYTVWRFRRVLRPSASGEWVLAGVMLVQSSILLRLLQLLQIHFFLKAAGVSVGLTTTIARVPLALAAGWAPLSIAGIGLRDAALIWLFQDVAPAAQMVVVGILVTSRYLAIGAVGCFCLGAILRRRKSGKRSEMPSTIAFPQRLSRAA